MVASFPGNVLAESCLQEDGRMIRWTSWKLSPDMKYILVEANHHKVCTSFLYFFGDSKVVSAMETLELRQLLRS